MPAMKEFYFPSSAGKNQIYVRMWVPDGDVRGTVQIAHGIAEYINRYDDFAQFLASNGFVVAGNDHLGHGKSMGSPENQGFFADSAGWDYVVADMEILHRTLKQEYPSVPAILFGHSMGSFLARTYIIKHPDDFDAAIISGTGHQSKLMVAGGLFLSGREVKNTDRAMLARSSTTSAWGRITRASTPRLERRPGFPQTGERHEIRR